MPRTDLKAYYMQILFHFFLSFLLVLIGFKGSEIRDRANAWFKMQLRVYVTTKEADLTCRSRRSAAAAALTMWTANSSCGVMHGSMHFLGKTE